MVPRGLKCSFVGHVSRRNCIKFRRPSHQISSAYVADEITRIFFKKIMILSEKFNTSQKIRKKILKNIQHDIFTYKPLDQHYMWIDKIIDMIHIHYKSRMRTINASAYCSIVAVNTIKIQLFQFKISNTSAWNLSRSKGIHRCVVERNIFDKSETYLIK